MNRASIERRVEALERAHLDQYRDVNAMTDVELRQHLADLKEQIALVAPGALETIDDEQEH